MNPVELLRLARLLAVERGGSPAWVARSRAVSTGYYALFHALAELCGRELVGARRPWPAYRYVYRSLDHAHGRRVLDAVRRDPEADEPLRIVGKAFTDLQQERHAADYDPGYRISTADLRILLSRAEQAIRSLDTIAPDDRKLLAARLIGRPRSS